MPNADTQVPPLLPSLAGPAPARLVRRTLSLVLDMLLAGTAAMLLLTAIIYPQNYPNYQEIMQVQGQAVMAQFQQALATGKFSTFNVSQDYLDMAATTGSTLFIVLVVYFAASEMLMGGATLGKRVFGLRAARYGTAEPPFFIETMSRCIFKATSLVWPVLLIANAVPILFRSTRRAGHDYLARTIVTGAAPPPARQRARDEDHG